MLNQPPTLDLLFQALADPTRRSMVSRLSRGPASVGELARPLPMSLPAVHQHLKVLVACGLVHTHKVGRVRTCEVNPQALTTTEQWISTLRTTLEQRLDRFGELLADETTDDRSEEG